MEPGRDTIKTLQPIKVTELPEEGTDLSLELHSEELKVDLSDVTVLGPLWLSAQLRPLGEGMLVEGVLRGILQRQCVRCLNHFQERCQYPFSAEYYPSQDERRRRTKETGRGPTSADSEAAGLGEREGYPIEEDVADLIPMLRELIILGCPLKPLCDEGCKGLCTVCGENQNLMSCGCVQEPPSPLRVALVRYREALQKAAAKFK